MSIAGELIVKARWDGQEVRRLEIVSTRPQAAPLLVGRRFADAEKMVPLLFAICARAQEAAARAAIQTACGIEPDCANGAQRARLVLVEAVQEHLWRLLLDWPAALDVPALRDTFLSWYPRVAAALRATDPAASRALGADILAFCDHELLPLPLADWEVLADPQLLFAACRRRGALSPTILALAELDGRGPSPSPIPLMPELSAAQLARCLPTIHLDRFAEAPTVDGAPRETGPLAQHRAVPLIDGLLTVGQRLLARMLARICALVACARGLMDDVSAAATIDTHAVADGIAVARVLTARGVLLHRVELDGERVAGYIIVAPTEWNFHPCGTLASEWEGRRFDSETGLLRVLRAAVLALDPCVAYRIGVEHA